MYNICTYSCHTMCKTLKTHDYLCIEQLLTHTVYMFINFETYMNVMKNEYYNIYI